MCAKRSFGAPERPGILTPEGVRPQLGDVSNSSHHGEDVAAPDGSVNTPAPGKAVAIVTRPVADAAEVSERLAAAGWRVVLSPAMEIVPVEAEIDLSSIGALAFTSANGVRAFAAASPAREFPVFAVGEATARTAETAGFDSILTAGGDVDALADLIGGAAGAGTYDRRQAVLHVAGSRRAGDLKAALEARGLSCRRLVLYDTRAIERPSADACAAIANAGDIDTVVLFYSPRTTRLFLEQLARAGLRDRTRDLVAACLSPAVADAAAAADWRAVRIADAPSGDRLLQMLQSGFHTQPA